MALLSVLGGASLLDGACQPRCSQRPCGKGAAQDRDPNPLLAPALSIEAGTRKIPHHPASNHCCTTPCGTAVAAGPFERLCRRTQPSGGKGRSQPGGRPVADDPPREWAALWG